MWLKVKRVAKTGFINFWRNGYVSLASLSVMTVTLVVVGMLIFAGTLFNASLNELKNKVDVNIYFVTDAPDEEILALKKQLEALAEVKEVQFLSKDVVLEQFKARHSNDELTLRSIEELGENPFGATLTVKAKETSQYESIAKFLETKSGSGTTDGVNSIISKVNYYDNKVAIESLSKIVASAKKIGAGVALVFILISILITFNTIRLAIYSSRDEISVMRLVGASTRYIKGPFVITGIMYGSIAGAITLVFLYGFAVWMGPSTETFFGGINIASYYVVNFAWIFLIIMGSGVVLGALASYLAVRKYLTL